MDCAYMRGRYRRGDGVRGRKARGGGHRHLPEDLDTQQIPGLPDGPRGAQPDRANHPTPLRRPSATGPKLCLHQRSAGSRTVRGAPFHRPQTGQSGHRVEDRGPACASLVCSFPVSFPRMVGVPGGPDFHADTGRVLRKEFLPQTHSGCQQPAKASTTASRAAGQSRARGCLHPPCDGRQGRC